MVRDLAAGGEFEVLAADASPRALSALSQVPGVTTLEADLSMAREVQSAVAGADLVVGAVPGHMGFATVKAVLEAGRPIVDISFFEQDPFLLDDLAKSKGLTAVVDCGIAPGCGNIILGYLETLLDRVDRFLCLVGGLPTVRAWPYEYKAPFSPSDVIEEYTRPARYVAHGQVVTLPALSEPELMDFPGVGTLEAFNTDGLRTLLHTVEAPFKKEKTLRYPGHIEKMRVMRETGLFSKDPVEIGGAKVVPLELTSRLLFHLWTFEEGEEDLTVMRVEVEGEKDGQRASYTYDLLDRCDAATGTLSMARTTGYTCTAVVRAVAQGLYRAPGISPPEYLGRAPGVYEFVMRELGARGVVFRETVG
jgi:saccharopine dehydrogenase-like NADP-dependent oxidoreductase